MNENIFIEYIFELADGSKEAFPVELNPTTLRSVTPLPDPLPNWVTLEFEQCQHCRLSSNEFSFCPTAASLVRIVEQSEKLLSYDTIMLQVRTNERTIFAETTAQSALCSLMGLTIAVSDCPTMAFFKPMARFHLPLASEEETIFRATATYMLSQYFVNQRESEADFAMKKLVKIYQDVQKVNMAMANRVRSASKTDSSINALVLLDMYAKALPYVLDQSLEEIRYIFEPFLAKD